MPMSDRDDALDKLLITCAVLVIVVVLLSLRLLGVYPFTVM